LEGAEKWVAKASNWGERSEKRVDDLEKWLARALGGLANLEKAFAKPSKYLTEE